MIMIEDISSEKRMKSTMSRYMDPGLADQLLKGGEDILGGKNTTATVLFSDRSEEHTSELQSLMRISYAVFCLKKKNTTLNTQKHQQYLHIISYRNITKQNKR